MNHAKILEAYLSRLSAAAMEQLAQAVYTGHYAAANLGTSSQLGAHELLRRKVDFAVSGLLVGDLQLIEDLIVEQVAASRKPDVYTTEGMLKITEEVQGRLGAKAQPDERFNVPLYALPQAIKEQALAVFDNDETARDTIEYLDALLKGSADR